MVATIVADTPTSILSRLPLDQERLETIRHRVEQRGPEDGAELVNDEIADAFVISGSVEDFLDAFDMLARMGVTEVVVGPPLTDDWRASMRDIVAAALDARSQ